MRRQAELQKEMDRKKKEDDEKRFSAKRKHHRSRSRRPSAEPVEQPQGLNFRSDSPPIPTMRSNQTEESQNKVEANAATAIGELESDNSQVVEQLQSLRKGLEKRQESLRGEDDPGAGGWDGLAEL